MSEFKFLNDGRKVKVIGKLNNQEMIVQEIFVTKSGDEIPSGESFTAKSLHDEPVLSYKDKEAMKKAETEFFSRFSNGGEAVADVGYPASWKSDASGMLEYVKKLHGEGKTHAEIAAETMLVGKNGEAVLTEDGKEVNAKKVLALTLDVPEPTVNL